MIQSVRQHYATHLGPIYSWMLGGAAAAVMRGDAEVDALGLHPEHGAVAIDLGAGIGMHSIPLARRGYSVVAIDSDAALLSELSGHAGGLSIRPAVADLLDFRAQLRDPADLILCMGDTLTHLPDKGSVTALIADVAAALSPAGLFVCTFRDYTQELSAEKRFLSVKSDSDRILTCFLEYGDLLVTVHDLLHEREDHHWRLRVSSYQKLRLAPGWVGAALEKFGFKVSQSTTPGGMVHFVARRSANDPAQNRS